MKPILVFDLDDTLYSELTYVYSGFQAVAAFLADYGKADRQAVYDMLICQLAHGRGRIFDHALRQLGLFSQKNVRRCVSVYRQHEPAITLYPEAAACLDRFGGLPLYIVTDGNKLVQEKKLTALDLFRRVKRCLITHRFGVDNAKPSPYCFLKICALEKACPQQIVYIADNVNKDFVGIKPLGFKTIRVLTGQHKDLKMPAEFEADFRITSLSELDRPLVDAILRQRGGSNE